MDAPATPAEFLAALPRSTNLVAVVDVAALRTSVLFPAVAALARENAQDQAIIDSFVERTGFDPFRQVQRLTFAFPEDARSKGEFALVIDAGGLAERRLVDYAREQAQKKGHSIDLLPRRGRVLWRSTGEDGTAFFFDGNRRVVLGAGGWAETMADLSDSVTGIGNAGMNQELADLCARAGTAHVAWFAGIIPAQTRRKLMADARFDITASVTRMAGSIDFDDGISAHLYAELGNQPDAAALVEKVRAFVREAKTNPKVLMLGLGGYVDAVAASANGSSVTVGVALGPAQSRDVLTRLAGLIKLRHER